MRVLLVGLQAHVVCEHSAAEVTPEWLVARMLPHVRVHVGLLAEAALADGTGVRLGVDQLVLLQVLGGLEGLPTDLTDACPLHKVTLGVLVQPRLEEEVRAANLADELLLPRRDYLMPLLVRDEALLIPENVPADATQVLLCLGVNASHVCLQIHEELLAVRALVEAHHALLAIGRQRQLHLDGSLVLLLKNLPWDVGLHVLVETEATLELFAAEWTTKVLAPRTNVG